MHKKLSWFDRLMMKLAIFKLFASTPDVFFRSGVLATALSETTDAIDKINRGVFEAHPSSPGIRD